MCFAIATFDRKACFSEQDRALVPDPARQRVNRIAGLVDALWRKARSNAPCSPNASRFR